MISAKFEWWFKRSGEWNVKTDSAAQEKKSFFQQLANLSTNCSPSPLGPY
jgi:hypothetical protein